MPENHERQLGMLQQRSAALSRILRSRKRDDVARRPETAKLLADVQAEKGELIKRIHAETGVK